MGLCHECWCKREGVDYASLSRRRPGENEARLDAHMMAMPAIYVCVDCKRSITNTLAHGMKGGIGDLLSILAAVAEVVMEEEGDDDLAVTQRDDGSEPWPLCHVCYHELHGERGCEMDPRTGICSWIPYRELIPEGRWGCPACEQPFPVLHRATQAWVRYLYEVAPTDGIGDNPEAVQFFEDQVTRRMLNRFN